MRFSVPEWVGKLVPSRKNLFFELIGTTIVAGLATVALVYLRGEVTRVEGEFTKLKNEDQVVRNNILEEEIKNIQSTFGNAAITYEDLVKLREQAKDTVKQDSLFAEILTLLSTRNYASASANLVTLKQSIADELAKITASFVIPANTTQSNTPPGSGYSRQSVSLDIGTYLVSMVAADMASTRVIVDTASDNTCTNDCRVLSLADYVSRNGAFAGVNGSYFCSAEYPSCAGKTNSFDTLLMNKNKVYFNSDNNVYSTVPAVIFLPGSMRFVGRSLEWGRDTSPDGVIANQPLLVSNGSVVFGGDDDPKKESKGNRSFVAQKGTTAYIGVVYMATVAESARVLQALGMDNALNLDDGGSTALWSGLPAQAGGYKVGPGRNLPNAILFVGK